MTRLDYDAMREGYRDLPSEHKVWAYYGVADSEGTYRLYPLTPSRLEWWVAAEWERAAAQPAGLD